MRTDFAQQEYRHVILRNLLTWLEKEMGFEFIETSNYRIGSGSVHNDLPVRGEDLRCRCIPVGQAIVDYINRHWRYDHLRPSLQCAILHGSGSDLHIHIQVHTNTVKTT